jgi:uncharacterized protein
MSSPLRRTRQAVAAVALLLAASPALARLVAEVRDDARMFKPETVKEADAIIKAIKHDHSLDLLVETFPGIPEEKKAAWQKAKDDKEKKRHFFAEWGRERFREAEVNGISLLVTKDPGHLQIEVGSESLRKAFTLKNRDHLEEVMLGHFKEKEFDSGLLEGVRYVRKAIDENLGTKRGAGAGVPAAPPAGHPAPGVDDHPSPFSGLWGWLCIGLLVVAGIWVLFAVIRRLSGAGRSYGPAGPGGYAAPGYGGGSGGGGGGFLTSMLGGLFGGAAGSWVYDRFFRGDSGHVASHGGGTDYGADPYAASGQPRDTDATGTGGDFGDDGGGGGDATGGDTGGGGGDFGGDTGGGGGDFGGDTGGGDFGGGGGGDTGGGGDF